MKAIRTLRRRHRTGTRGVVAAWWEARDLLRAHGSPVTPGMTDRDLARAATGASIVDGLLALAHELDVVRIELSTVVTRLLAADAAHRPAEASWFVTRLGVRKDAFIACPRAPGARPPRDRRALVV